jgi:hypothetical protein
VSTSTLSAISINENPSSKQAGVDGPCARPEQCKAGAQDCQQEMSPRISRLRQYDPHLSHRNCRSGEGRPQTSEQKDSRDGRD